MEDKEKITIARDLLKKYLEDFKDKKSSIYYAMLNELDVLYRFLEDEELTEQEMMFIKEILKADKIKYGKYSWTE